MKTSLNKILAALCVCTALAACASQNGRQPVQGTQPSAYGAAPNADYHRWNSLVNQISMSGGRQLGITTEAMQGGALLVRMPQDAAFDSAQSALKPAVYPVLNALTSEINQRGELRVRVVGHADSSGNHAISQPLSEQRAAAVGSYLINRGVYARRISTQGRSAEVPITDNSTPEGRRLNRRVEILLYPVTQSNPDQFVQ